MVGLLFSFWNLPSFQGAFDIFRGLLPEEFVWKGTAAFDLTKNDRCLVGNLLLISTLNYRGEFWGSTHGIVLWVYPMYMMDDPLRFLGYSARIGLMSLDGIIQVYL